MSKKLIYAVYDSNVEAYLKPFFVVTEAQAIRAVQAAARDDASISSFPQDFQLYFLGSFDEVSGLFTDNSLRRVGSALELLQLHRKEIDAQQAQINFGDTDEGH